MGKKSIIVVWLVALTLAPFPLAEAQQPGKIPRVGVLVSATPAIATRRVEALLRGLRELGYVEGKNISLEYRYAEGRQETLSERVAELIRLNVDIIVTDTSNAIQAAKDATQIIPIVFTVAIDPVGDRQVSSLARPGGNLTGLSILAPELNGKRLEHKYENVGSRDWMPGWSMGVRIEDIRPAVDVFSLGKLFWAMLSGRSFLRLWYHHEDDFELETMFPSDELIRWARPILDMCIGEKEKDCLQTSTQLLAFIDEILPAVRCHAQVVGDGIVRRCDVCGRGVYKAIVDRLVGSIRNLGINPVGDQSFKVFSCSYCGHVQFFYISDPSQRPPAWKR